MKFTVYYGRDFLKGKETGKQAVKRLLSEKPESEYNKNIISVADNKGWRRSEKPEGSHDRI